MAMNSASVELRTRSPRTRRATSLDHGTVSFDGNGTIAGTGAGLLTINNLTVRQGTVTLSRNVTTAGLTLGIDGGTAATLRHRFERPSRLPGTLRSFN